MIASSEVPDKDGNFGAGWCQSQIDSCVFYRRQGKGFGILCCHVDDSMLVCTKDEEGQRIRKEFSVAYGNRFEVSPECTDGDVHEYLSMLIKIDREKGTLTFQMPKLMKKLKILLQSIELRRIVLKADLKTTWDLQIQKDRIRINYKITLKIKNSL